MARSARPDILAAWAGCLVRHGYAADLADALALELEQIAANRGVSIDRLRPSEDPAAGPEWREPHRLQAAAGDATAGLAQVRREAGLDPKETE